MDIQNQFLTSGEYFSKKYPKDKIFIHHTAGSYRPDWVIHGWQKDKNKNGTPRAVATAFVVGGASTWDNDKSWDGIVMRCFPEECWAYHLGMKGTWALDKSSIGIEICNYGQLTLKNGQFFNAYGGVVKEDRVIELVDNWRGYTYFEKYTEPQIESVRKLLLMLSEKFEIDLCDGLRYWLDKEGLMMPSGLSVKEQQAWLNKHGFVGKDGESLVEDGVYGENTRWAISSVGESAFELNAQALDNQKGLWTHTNVRKDKWDCVPQPMLKEMILSL